MKVITARKVELVDLNGRALRRRKARKSLEAIEREIPVIMIASQPEIGLSKNTTYSGVEVMFFTYGPRDLNTVDFAVRAVFDEDPVGLDFVDPLEDDVFKKAARAVALAFEKQFVGRGFRMPATYAFDFQWPSAMRGCGVLEPGGEFEEWPQ